MEKIICPFCKEETISDVCFMFDKKTRDYINGIQIYKCNKCGLFGNKKLVQELIRTHKVLSDTIKLAEEMLVDIEYEGLCSSEYKERLNKIKSITKGGDNE